jgi:hypothetical protein
VYCIFAKSTNSNVLGKLPISMTRTIGKLEVAIGRFGKNTIVNNTHVTGEGPDL